MEKERHLKQILVEQIKWPKNMPMQDLLALVLQRIPSYQITYYNTMEVKAFFKRNGLLYEGNYILVADKEKNAWLCTEFDFNSSDSQWKEASPTTTSGIVGFVKNLKMFIAGEETEVPQPIKHNTESDKVKPQTEKFPQNFIQTLSPQFNSEEKHIFKIEAPVTKEEILKTYVASLTDNELPIHLAQREKKENYEICAAIRDEIIKRKAAN